MARQFQGYARGRGFTSRSPGAGAVSRIQEQGNKTIQGLKEQLQSKRQKDQQYIADLDSNFRRDQAIKGEIKQFEDKAFALKMSNIKQNQEQSLENIKTEASNQARVAEQLSEFSTTLGKSIYEVKDAIETAKFKADVTTSIMGPFPEKPSEADKAAKEALRQANATTQADLQDSVVRDGLSQATAQKQKAASPFAHLQSVDAKIAHMPTRFLELATHDNHGNDLVHQIIDELDLYGVRRSRFYDAALEIKKIRAGFKADNRKVAAINQSAEIVNTAMAQVLRSKSSEDMEDFIITLKSHTTNGETAITNPDQLDILMDLWKNPAFSNQDRERFMDLQMRDKNGKPLGRTYRDQFSDTRLLTLRNEVEKERIDRVDRQNDIVKAEQLDNYLKTRTEIFALRAQGKIDYDTYKSSLENLDVSKDQRTKLYELLYSISNDKVSNDAYAKEADHLMDTGRDPTEVISRMTGKTLATYTDKLNKYRKVFTKAQVDDKKNRERIFDAGKIRLGISNIGTVKDPSLGYATDDRLARMQTRRAELMRTQSMDMETANRVAMGEMLDLIQSSELPEYKPSGTGTGNQRDIPAGSRTGVMGRGTRRKSTSNYYAYYSPGGTYFENIVQANTHQALQAVRARPDSRKDVFLVPTTSLAGIYNGIISGKTYELPETIKQLQKAYPDTLQLQLNKYADEFELPKITVPLTYQQILSQEQNDRRAQQFMQQVETIQEERIIPIVADPSARSDSRYRSDVVNQRRLIMEIPAVEGGIQGLTVQDYDELAYIASKEAGPGDDPYLVAGTALNRLASGKYGASLYDIARAPGQYEAVYKGEAHYDPARAKEFASPAGQRKLRGILELLNGRTDFKGQRMLQNRHESDVMVDPSGNFAHYAGQTPNSGAYTGPIDSSFRRFFN